MCQGLSPDGRIMALRAYGPQRMCLVDRLTGNRLLEIATAKGPIGEQIIFSPDGRWAAMVVSRSGRVNTLVVMEVGTPGNRPVK